MSLAMLAFGMALIHALMLDRWYRAIIGERVIPVRDPGGTSAILSVIVPARDAAHTLGPLLQDLYAQTHPKDAYEVMVVDDHSSDGTVALVEGMAERWPQLRVLSLAEEVGKKAAIAAGVEQARGEVLVMTDADVRCGPERLGCIAAYWKIAGPDMLLMPVHTIGGSGIVAWLQRKEQAALQGVAMGSVLVNGPLLANGANMAFSRKAFERVGGYAGERFASGDDMFLLARMRAHGLAVDGLAQPEVVVHTAPVSGWGAFFAQRSRWAGKMRAYQDLGALVGAVAALLLPWSLAFLSLWVARHVQVGQGLFYTATLLAAAWLAWLFPVLRLAGVSERSYLLAAGEGVQRAGDGPFFTLPALAAFLIYAPVIALLSIFVRPTWKGRRV